MKLSMFYKTSVLGLALTSVGTGANLLGLFDTGSGSYSVGSFDSTKPGAVASNAVTGLASGEVLNGLDFRPATGQVYAFGATGNVYTLSPAGGATNIGTFASTIPGSNFGFDFNPAFTGGEFARIISDLDDNRVISGETGQYLGADKTDVFYAAGDANEGTNPNIVHIGYTNSVLGSTSTQQYGIDSSLDVLVTVANNAGTLVTVGDLGIDAGELGGFDIDGASGEAFLAYQNGGASELYSVDLTSGTATSIGGLSGNIIGLTSVPEPSSALLLSLAGLSLVGFRRR